MGLLYVTRALSGLHVPQSGTDLILWLEALGQRGELKGLEPGAAGAGSLAPAATESSGIMVHSIKA